MIIKYNFYQYIKKDRINNELLTIFYIRFFHVLLNGLDYIIYLKVILRSLVVKVDIFDFLYINMFYLLIDS